MVFVCCMCRWCRAKYNARKKTGLVMPPVSLFPPILARLTARSFSAGMVSGLRAKETAFRINMDGVTVSSPSNRLSSLLPLPLVNLSINFRSKASKNARVARSENDSSESGFNIKQPATEVWS